MVNKRLVPYNEKVRPRRIIHIVYWLMRGGIETWLLELVRSQNPRQYRHDILCVGPCIGDLEEQFFAAGSQVLHCPMSVNLLSFAARLEKQLRDSAADALHVHTGVHSGVPVYVANRLGIASLVHMHSTSFLPGSERGKQFHLRIIRKLYGRLGLSYAISNAQISLAVSSGVAAAVQRYTRVKRDKISVCYLGVPDAPKTLPGQRDILRRGLGVKHHQPLLLHVGSYREAKNHRGLLRVFKSVLSAKPDSRLLIVGDGEQKIRDQIRRDCNSLDLQEAVLLLGCRNNVSELMQAADIMLLPSKYEGLPLVIMEAAAAQLPVVASDLPGIREATDDGNAARLCAVTDEKGLANCVIELLENPDLARLLAGRSRQNYEQQFSLDHCIRRLERLYNQCISQAGTRAITAA